MISITIDCEEWNSPLLRGIFVKENNNTDFSREGNKNLLKLLDKYDIKATFFVTGYFAEREKEQVKEILRKGHEIACHGYNHFYRKNKNLDIENDVKKSKKIIEKIIKKKVIGFRAPQMQFSLELIKILDKQGFKYDSSIHPAFLPGYYYNFNYPLNVYKPIKNLKIREIPTAVIPFLRLPINWVFMRNLSYKWASLGVNSLLKKNITPVLYFHSWEFTKLNSRYVPYLWKRNTGERFCLELEKFIKRFKNEKFVKVSEI